MGADVLSSRAVIGKFYAALEAYTGASWIDAVSMLFNSDQDSETYKWLGMVPAMREWLGGKQAKGFRDNGITIVNKDFEASLEILRKWLRRDKTGQLAAVNAIMGVIGYMLNYKDDQGEPMNSEAKKFLVMTSPALWTYLVKATSQTVNSGDSNILLQLAADGFEVRVVANPRLTYTTQFVTFRTDAPASAMIRQEEVPIQMKALAEGSDYAFMNAKHLYSVEATRNVAYGYWQYASHSTFS